MWVSSKRLYFLMFCLWHLFSVCFVSILGELCYEQLKLVILFFLIVHTKYLDQTGHQIKIKKKRYIYFWIQLQKCNNHLRGMWVLYKVYAVYTMSTHLERKRTERNHSRNEYRGQILNSKFTHKFVSAAVGGLITL